MAGLPGSGKSSVAEPLAERIGAVCLSVDPLESSLLEAGIGRDQPTGLAAYLVAEHVAEQALRAGHPVVVDAVNPVEPARLQWRGLAERTGATLRFVETVCSDADEHRRRLAGRRHDLPGLDEVTWERAEERAAEYEEWLGEAGELTRLTLDTVAPVDGLVERAASFVAG